MKTLFPKSPNIFLVILLFSLSCSGVNDHNSIADKNHAEKHQLNSDSLLQNLISIPKSATDITQKCQDAILEFQQVNDKLKKNSFFSAWKFSTNLGVFEEALADFGDKVNPLTFMGYVSPDQAVRDAASQCEEKVGQFLVDVYLDKKLYQKLKQTFTFNKNEKRLFDKTMQSFEENGMQFSASDLEKLKALRQRLTALETEFSKNYNNDVTKVPFYKIQLIGLSEDLLSRFERNKMGQYLIKTKQTEYIQLMENARLPATRKKMLEQYVNVAATSNTPLLQEAIKLRFQIATLLGFANWADYRTQSKMALNGDRVKIFLDHIKDKLKVALNRDMAQILKAKQVDAPNEKIVNPWDIAYYKNQISKNEYNVDSEIISQYFPADYVITKMFEIYSKLLSVDFKKVSGAPVWAPGVTAYKILDKVTNNSIAYFYMDMIPRDGKYGHAAAFPLIAGRIINQNKNNSYSLPIAAIIANLTPPTATKPSLLTHDEVETLFHEFGHIMHQTLTRAPYASLSGTAVAQDFVEAPSQMLENWVWDKEMLRSISSHYQTHQPLPDDLINKLQATKRFMSGYFYSRQALLASFDLQIHSGSGVEDVTLTYQKLYEQFLGVKPLANDHFPAGFGHLMGGYDAGYYGYLWSEVYAQDMFSEFEKAGLLNEALGARYRNIILANGNMQDALVLVEEFLQRKSNNQAFLRKLGIE